MTRADKIEFDFMPKDFNGKARISARNIDEGKLNIVAFESP